MPESSNVRRARDFRPAEYVHMPADVEGETICAAAFGVPTDRSWARVTCPRCHAEGVIEVGLAAHYARASLGSTT